MLKANHTIHFTATCHFAPQTHPQPKNHPDAAQDLDQLTAGTAAAGGAATALAAFLTALATFVTFPAPPRQFPVTIIAVGLRTIAVVRFGTLAFARFGTRTNDRAIFVSGAIGRSGGRQIGGHVGSFVEPWTVGARFYHSQRLQMGYISNRGN